MDSEDLILRFEQWQNEVRREVERQGRYSQALNSILIVGAFIAGVQGQLLSVTLELDPNTVRARACNLISFLGLVTEIAGTFFGAVNAVKLQLKAQRGTRALDRMEECKGSMKFVMKFIAKKRAMVPPNLPKTDPPKPSSSQASSSSADGPSEPQDRRSLADELNLADADFTIGHPQSTATNIVYFANDFGFITSGLNRGYLNYHGVNATGREDRLEHCTNIIDTLNQVVLLLGYKPSWTLLSGIDATVHAIRTYEATGQLSPDEEGREKWWTMRRRSLRCIDLPADVPDSPLEKISLEMVSLVAMGFGVLCLAVSIIIFAAARTDILGNQVWATCVAVLLVITLFSVLPFVPSRFVHAFMRCGA
ncbi:hypothetical protein BKA70DRAFT_1301696 [Coprinopsis sp. MPI-PUGE-AT-0042]|nr:hypothetical protein BKA70DRAFT_1301696 [Coprinopsis sp. MPI-PUGE-AT-0042]